MKLLVSGSPHLESSNSRFLAAIGQLSGTGEYLPATYLAELPVFQPALDHAPWPANVLRWREDVASAEAIFICTPAYLHNIPGVLKNALDWLASSGEMSGKSVVAMTLTPNAPRGEKAMQSLLWSLSALDARVVAAAPFYRDDVRTDSESQFTNPATAEMLQALLEMLP
ncbi:NADPH-dependent FMN reductase [Lewinella sp. 4G2]|uniref:NADPH-dependent FMN reductase n=1 Tax=Lewinella sp. 4G2 TaxID=1803372 RepID=UPI0007B4BE42|nr:NADPH-dependent FMN reductase [Lewinella sp. 4G2]OAV44435.1 hypothetical protein A3850_007985 [Lewinella sp. 4G2]